MAAASCLVYGMLITILLPAPRGQRLYLDQDGASRLQPADVLIPDGEGCCIGAIIADGLPGAHPCLRCRAVLARVPLLPLLKGTLLSVRLLTVVQYVPCALTANGRRS